MNQKRFQIILLVSLLLLSCTLFNNIPAAPTRAAIPPAASATSPGAASPVPPDPGPTNLPGSAQEGLGDLLYPTLGNAGYDVQRYTIELNVDVKKNAIAGSCTLQAVATQSLTTFSLDFHGLDISKVLVNDSPATFSRTGDKLLITPSGVLAVDSAFVTSVTYSGSPEPVDDPSSPGSPVGWLSSSRAGIYVASEVSGAMGWYPVNNTPLDKATYSFKITAPRSYVVAANGLLKGTTDNGDTRTFLWEENVPMASYLATVEIGDYQLINLSGPNGLPIRNYVPADSISEVEKTAGKTAEMIQYFTSIYGPYPFEAYGIVVVPEDLGYAEENQTLSVFGADMLDELTVVHELSHQWFGDSLSLASWQDMWLNEGFATYSEALWTEHLEGKAAGENYMRDLYEQSASDKSPVRPAAHDLFGDSVYNRGALVLYALRQKVGDAVFFKILHEYYLTYAGRNATSADFIAAARKVSNQDLQGLFADWLYSDRMPPFPN